MLDEQKLSSMIQECRDDAVVLKFDIDDAMTRLIEEEEMNNGKNARLMRFIFDALNIISIIVGESEEICERAWEQCDNDHEACTAADCVKFSVHMIFEEAHAYIRNKMDSSWGEVGHQAMIDTYSEELMNFTS